MRATEGNVSLYNVEGKVGAIGRVPPFLAHRFPLALVKFDHAEQRAGARRRRLCIRCATDETGEAIGRMHDGLERRAPAANFEGYTSADESERKILRDVFEPGDAWFRTGDLMRMDRRGFYYFVDRIGDTFRWKGENVATSEVAAAIAAFPGIAEATVYGVTVPGHRRRRRHGRAGRPTARLILPKLRKHLARSLPAYARPLFLRIQDRIDVTATFKHQKNDLAREGFDPAATSDAIYFDDTDRQAYIRLDAALFSRINAGAVRL